MPSESESDAVSDLNSIAEQGILDFQDIPIIPIDSPKTRLTASREGLYLVIRCVVNISTPAMLNFGRSGEAAVRIGDGGVFRTLGIIKGVRDGGHLSVAVYLEEGPDVITFICRYPEAEAMQLQCTREFDAIVIGNGKDALIARPVIARPLTVTVRGVTRISKKGTAILTLKLNGEEKAKVTNTNATFASIPEDPKSTMVLELPKSPEIELNSGNSGGDQWEVGLTILPKAI
jgi:hypothetical protein